MQPFFATFFKCTKQFPKMMMMIIIIIAITIIIIINYKPQNSI